MAPEKAKALDPKTVQNAARLQIRYGTPPVEMHELGIGLVAVRDGSGNYAVIYDRSKFEHAGEPSPATLKSRADVFAAGYGILEGTESIPCVSSFGECMGYAKRFLKQTSNVACYHRYPLEIDPNDP